MGDAQIDYRQHITFTLSYLHLHSCDMRPQTCQQNVTYSKPVRHPRGAKRFLVLSNLAPGYEDVPEQSVSPTIPILGAIYKYLVSFKPYPSLPPCKCSR
jgi:hypothetical protein